MDELRAIAGYAGLVSAMDENVGYVLRALNDAGASDDTLVGVLYLLGYASESLQKWEDAVRYYERVFTVDIQFRDVGDRLSAVERKAAK